MTACQNESVLISPEEPRKYRSSCLITLTWQDEKSHRCQPCMTADTHWLYSFFSLQQSNVSAAAYQRPQTNIMKLNWASTAIKPHLQYQHSILQIIHSLLWILRAIRPLPGDWGEGKWLNLGISGALTGSRASPFQPFIRPLLTLPRRISTWDQNTPTKSQHSRRRQIDPGVRRGGGGVGGCACCSDLDYFELGKNASVVPAFILV